MMCINPHGQSNDRQHQHEVNRGGEVEEAALYRRDEDNAQLPLREDSVLFAALIIRGTIRG
jgi:hypothetical protein